MILNLKKKIKSQALSFFRELNALTTFVTAENINQLLQKQGFIGNIGILSLDINGQ